MSPCCPKVSWLLAALLGGCASSPPPSPSAPPAPQVESSTDQQPPPLIAPPAKSGPSTPASASEALLPPDVERRGPYLIERTGGRVCVRHVGSRSGNGLCGGAAPHGPWTRIEVAGVSGGLDAAGVYQGLAKAGDALRGCWLQGSADNVELALFIGTAGAPLAVDPLGEEEIAGCMAVAVHVAARFPEATTKTRVKVRLRRVP